MHNNVWCDFEATYRRPPPPFQWPVCPPATATAWLASAGSRWEIVRGHHNLLESWGHLADESPERGHHQKLRECEQHPGVPADGDDPGPDGVTVRGVGQVQQRGEEVAGEAGRPHPGLVLQQRGLHLGVLLSLQPRQLGHGHRGEGELVLQHGQGRLPDLVLNVAQKTEYLELCLVVTDKLHSRREKHSLVKPTLDVQKILVKLQLCFQFSDIFIAVSKATLFVSIVIIVHATI